MAALTRPTEATYEVHENVTVDTYGKFRFGVVVVVVVVVAETKNTPTKEDFDHIRFLSYPMYTDTICDVLI